MAVNTQFSIAVHILAGLGYRCGGNVTSSTLAHSVNTSPSFVRRILAKLSKARLVHTTTGKTGACCLARDPANITLLEVYQAVDAPKAFAIHKYNAQKPCPVSCQIKSSLEGVLHKTQQSLENSLAKITLADVISDLKRK
ncbi:Rrf2 family transcriptional regulator [Pedosphaera parvula]|uniref:Transcriptional regulator, BadM/Rrf2 family n=1 Tax=Pedosphaera parvula (strain Ellin514) TaxID=320771 RepID=B9XQS7_PEDPL|nr:Rrf2 family transcriptional regulator [Pedosphaera parvula]EEF57784.1 transcriptional regulator, BadM/Rrf2 family [Pedosphaera parvula Ellin514]